ncbi:MAG TPA: transcription termination factor NusA [Ardenticatenaceae bacterium]
MRNNEFMMALNALCAERDLSKDVVFDAIETALHAAYRRDFEQAPNVTVTMDRSSGEAKVFVEWNVVDEVQDDRYEIPVDEARATYGPEHKAGDVVREERTPKNFGRIAAQTAKQVILQRIREAERDKLYTDYASRESEIIMGTVQSLDSKTGAVRLSLGKAEALLPRGEQLPGERYRIGQRVRAYVFEVNRANRGPQITVSRTHKQMLRRLLELEVPEIANGTVEIRSIAREPGARSKVAVSAVQPGIDPVGACVGMKGTRIQSIVNELNGEKIDVVQWNPDESAYVANALSPAKVIETFLEENNDEGKTAIVVVPDKQLSLAIGKEGQNARLAAKLTGWRIDIKSASEAGAERVRLTEMEARRREDELRRRREDEERLTAARALLAAAEGTDEGVAEDEVLVPVSAVDELAFSQPVMPEIVAPVAEREPEVEERPAAAAAPIVEQPVLPIVERQPQPPTPQPQRPTVAAQPQPVEVFDYGNQVEEEEEDVEEEDATPAARSKSTMIFYTMNARGESESLDDAVERRKDKKKKGKGSGGGGGGSGPSREPGRDDRDRGGPRGGGGRDSGRRR